MARTTALRIRMDLALRTDASSMSVFAETVQKVEALKKTILEAGFVFAEDVTSRVGSFEFADENPPTDAVIPGAESE